VFGELHGNYESPTFFGAAVSSALSATNMNVLVGLELPVAMQATIDTYLRSSGDPESREALLQHSFWHRQMQDGKSSAAMFDLLEHFRQLGARYSGRLLVRAIDGVRADQQQPSTGSDRDAILARNATDDAANNSDGVSLFLVGNFHSRRQPLNGLDYIRPMASLLQVPFISVQIVPNGGTSWNCQAGCGDNSVMQFVPGLEALANYQNDGEYDYVVDLGPVTSAEPAIWASVALETVSD